MTPTYFSTTRESCWSLIRWLPLKLIFLIFGSLAANSTGLTAEAGKAEAFGSVFDVLLVSALGAETSVWASVFAIGLPAIGASS